MYMAVRLSLPLNDMIHLCELYDGLSTPVTSSGSAPRVRQKERAEYRVNVITCVLFLRHKRSPKHVSKY